MCSFSASSFVVRFFLKSIFSCLYHMFNKNAIYFKWKPILTLKFPVNRFWLDHAALKMFFCYLSRFCPHFHPFFPVSLFTVFVCNQEWLNEAVLKAFCTTWLTGIFDRSFAFAIDIPLYFVYNILVNTFCRCITLPIRDWNTTIPSELYLLLKPVVLHYL